MVRKTVLGASLLALFLGLALMAGCAGTDMAKPDAKMAKPAAKAAPMTFPCVAKDKMATEIAPEAELVSLTCFFDKYKGKKSLHFKVAIKNVSMEDQRYRVNIFLDDGKAVGGLIPRKTKKGLVKPGATASFTYPVQGYDQPAPGILLVVKTLSK